MKFNDFVKIYCNVPLIDSSTFTLYSKKAEGLRRQVSDWIKKGYLIQIKKGFYIFSDEYRKIYPSVLFLANFLEFPSYISLEYALNFYGLIPEKVTVITSVTTKKTNDFNNCLGRFEYRTIKEDLFFGFREELDREQKFLIALPEKAILDFFYLNTRFLGKYSEFESLRLQNLEKLDIDLLSHFSYKYNERTKKVAGSLKGFILEYKDKYKTI